jgi:hypothetical protein
MGDDGLGGVPKRVPSASVRAAEEARARGGGQELWVFQVVRTENPKSEVRMTPDEQ